MVIQGTDLMAWISDNESGQPKSVGGATSHTLSLNQSLTSVSCKDYGSGRWSQQAPGLLDWSVSSEHYVIDTQNNQSAGVTDSSFATLDDSRFGLGYADMFNYMVARKPIFLTFGIEGSSKSPNEKKDHPDSSTNGWAIDKTKHGYYCGYAYITSLVQNAPNGDLASYSIELTGTGELKLMSGTTVKYSEPEPTPVVPTTVKKTSASV